MLGLLRQLSSSKRSDRVGITVALVYYNIAVSCGCGFRRVSRADHDTPHRLGMHAGRGERGRWFEAGICALFCVVIVIDGGQWEV